MSLGLHDDIMVVPLVAMVQLGCNEKVVQVTLCGLFGMVIALLNI